MLDIIYKILNKLRIRIFNDLLIERRYYKAISKSGISIRKSSNFYTINLFDFVVFLRRNSSDILVFNQIFINEEYSRVIQLISLYKLEINNILDLGANIGLSSLYFRKHLPNSMIICVEPDVDNFKILKSNTENNSPNNIEIMNVGIWYTNMQLAISRNFRDKKSWSITLDPPGNKSNLDSLVQGMTVDQVLNQNRLDKIDFIKIDIEGAESYIFNEQLSNLNFLNNIKIIAIELHEEVVNARDFESILESYDFKIYKSGELTIGIKKSEIIN